MTMVRVRTSQIYSVLVNTDDLVVTVGLVGTTDLVGTVGLVGITDLVGTAFAILFTRMVIRFHVYVIRVILQILFI